jgi:putative membrane protein
MVEISPDERLDVDVRFLLSNERTLLAWIRTSLTVQAGGVALAAFHATNPIPGIVVLLLGVVVALIGYNRYKLANDSIRVHKLPPTGVGPLLQVYGIVGIAVAVAIAQVTIFR